MSVPYRQRGLMDKRNRDLARVDDMTVKHTRVVGRALVVNAGEAAVELRFPVLFGNRPIFTFGGELHDNHHATLLQYPTVSAVITDWVTEPTGTGLEPRYKGARIAMVTTGQADQQMWLHYSFEAKAIRNPLATVDTADDVI